MSKKEIIGGIILIAILITGLVIKNYLVTGKKITQDTSKARHVSEDDIKSIQLIKQIDQLLPDIIFIKLF